MGEHAGTVIEGTVIEGIIRPIGTRGAVDIGPREKRKKNTFIIIIIHFTAFIHNVYTHRKFDVDHDFVTVLLQTISMYLGLFRFSVVGVLSSWGGAKIRASRASEMVDQGEED